MGQTWIGVVLMASVTSLPELVTGISSVTVYDLPNIAAGDVLGSCMFNLLILSLMDAVQPEPISARAHQGHALSIGFGLLLIGVAGVGLVADHRLPALLDRRAVEIDQAEIERLKNAPTSPNDAAVYRP